MFTWTSPTAPSRGSTPSREMATSALERIGDLAVAKRHRHVAVVSDSAGPIGEVLGHARPDIGVVVVVGPGGSPDARRNRDPDGEFMHGRAAAAHRYQ